MKRAQAIKALYIAVLVQLVAVGMASGQQLEPRAYSPAPVGTNIAGVAFLYSSGSAVLDPSLPIENVTARVNMAVPFYSRTFGLLGRQASLGIATPAADATVDGDVMESHRTVDRSGFGDPALRFSMNLVGGSGIESKESLPAQAGDHRRHELQRERSCGAVRPGKTYQPWCEPLVAQAGTRAVAARRGTGFSKSTEGSGCSRQTTSLRQQRAAQNPLASYQGHVVYTFLPACGLPWTSPTTRADQRTISGQNKGDRQDNTRTGLTFALPVTNSQSLKLSWSRGVSTRIGSDFDTLGVAWQWIWF